MNIDPTKSTLSFREIGETSLAVPSDGASHSGQRRVKEQVSTMTRSKHKYSVRGSAGTSSPTSPKSDSVFYETKYSPTIPINGSAFTYDGSMANGNAKMKQQKQSVMQRSVSTKSASYQRNQSNSMLPKSLPALNHLSLQPEFHATPSLGNATLSSAQYKQTKTHDRRYSHLPPNSPNQIVTVNTIQKSSNSSLLYGSQTNSRQPLSPKSNLEHRYSVISRGKMDMNGLNGEAHSADISLSDAVYWLTIQDENYQLHGASIIQHSTFTDDKAKVEVRKLQGISSLVSLLNSPHPQIQEVTASALRNIVFKNPANKEEVRQKGGVTEALNLLQNTDSPEIQKHVTGLLWNLSSADSVQPELLRHALPVLTDRILKLKDSEDTSWIGTDADAHTDSFYHATGCLRNLSSGKSLQNRQALRNCDGLIDSLVTHVQTCATEDLLDSKSLENCVCVLHNLTYQLDTETPNMFSKLNSFAKNVESQHNIPDTGPIGCFSNQSRKVQSESNINYPTMDVSNPKGKDLLIHSKTLMSYLKLLSTSENTAIQEACCGILHNLTAKKGIVSDVMSHIIVQKLNGAQYLTPVLQSENTTLKNAAIKLMGNLSRTPHLQKQLARQSLPDVVSALRSGFPYGADPSPDSDSVIATACQVTNNLVRADPDVGKKLLSTNLINSLNDISQNISLPNASKAAGILLHNLWSDKTIQPILRKIGMSKKSFVNDITSAALKSVQVVD